MVLASMDLLVKEKGRSRPFGTVRSEIIRQSHLSVNKLGALPNPVPTDVPLYTPLAAALREIIRADSAPAQAIGTYVVHACNAVPASLVQMAVM